MRVTLQDFFGLDHDLNRDLTYFESWAGNQGRSYAALALNSWRQVAPRSPRLQLRLPFHAMMTIRAGDYATNCFLPQEIEFPGGALTLFGFSDGSLILARRIGQTEMSMNMEDPPSHELLPWVFRLRRKQPADLPKLCFLSNCLDPLEYAVFRFEGTSLQECGTLERTREKTLLGRDLLTDAMDHLEADLTSLSSLFDRCPDLSFLTEDVTKGHELGGVFFSDHGNGTPIPPCFPQVGLTEDQYRRLASELSALVTLVLHYNPTLSDNPPICDITLSTRTDQKLPKVGLDFQVRTPPRRSLDLRVVLDALLERTGIERRALYGFSLADHQSKSSAFQFISIFGFANQPLSAHDRLALLEHYPEIDIEDLPASQ